MTISVSNDFLSTIKVVAFDFDQTLVDEPYSVRHRWLETLQSFSFLSNQLEKTFLSIFDVKGHTYKKHLNDTLQALDLPDTYLHLIIDSFRSTKSTTESLHKGVREVLMLLREKGFRVGIMTDGVQAYQEHRLKIAGIYDLFDFFYYGDSHQKPDPAFFRRCIEEEEIEPQELLYVGDHITKDIEGALATGAKACWISAGDVTFLPKGAVSFESMYTLYQWLQGI